MLVMIPALGCDEGLYAEIAPELEKTVSLRTIITDRDRIEDCVAKLLPQAPEEFVVMGTSFGGRVALETALAAPGRVKGLVMIGASAGLPPDRAAGLRRSQRLRGGEFEQVVSEMAGAISYLPGPRGHAAREAFIAMAHRLGPEGMARQSDAIAYRADLWGRLGEIACPALLLWGEHDQFVSAAEGFKQSTAINGARYVEIPDCGHFPPLEAPDETAAAIADWLIDHNLT
jgi:pimeloyl-ACP methyl ester carboxylesterase